MIFTPKSTLNLSNKLARLKIKHHFKRYDTTKSHTIGLSVVKSVLALNAKACIWSWKVADLGQVWMWGYITNIEHFLRKKQINSA